MDGFTFNCSLDIESIAVVASQMWNVKSSFHSEPYSITRLDISGCHLSDQATWIEFARQLKLDFGLLLQGRKQLSFSSFGCRWFTSLLNRMSLSWVRVGFVSSRVESSMWPLVAGCISRHLSTPSSESVFTCLFWHHKLSTLGRY